MKRHIHLSEEQNRELEELLKKEKRAKIYRRLLFIQMKHQGKKNTDIMKIIPVSINLLSDWTTLFLTHGFEGLCSLQYEGRRPGKLESEKETILQHLEETTVSTLAELKKWIEEHLGIFVQTSWLSVWCKKNKIILTKRQKDFQENSNQKISKNLL